MTPDNIPVYASNTLFYPLVQKLITGVIIASFFTRGDENQEPGVVGDELIDESVCSIMSNYPI